MREAQRCSHQLALLQAQVKPLAFRPQREGAICIEFLPAAKRDLSQCALQLGTDLGETLVHGFIETKNPTHIPIWEPPFPTLDWVSPAFFHTYLPRAPPLAACGLVIYVYVGLNFLSSGLMWLT